MKFMKKHIHCTKIDKQMFAIEDNKEPSIQIQLNIHRHAQSLVQAFIFTIFQKKDEKLDQAIVHVPLELRAIAAMPSMRDDHIIYQSTAYSHGSFTACPASACNFTRPIRTCRHNLPRKRSVPAAARTPHDDVRAVRYLTGVSGLQRRVAGWPTQVFDSAMRDGCIPVSLCRTDRSASLTLTNAGAVPLVQPAIVASQPVVSSSHSVLEPKKGTYPTDGTCVQVQLTELYALT